MSLLSLQMVLCCNVVLYAFEEDEEHLPFPTILFEGFCFDIPKCYLDVPVLSVRPGDGCLHITIGA